MKPLLIFSLLVGMLFVSVPARAANEPYLTMSKFTGQPGTKITVTGGNFPAGDSLQLFLNSGPDPVSQTTANQVGNFSANLTIPITAKQGSLSVTAKGTTGSTATNAFYVQPFAPVMQIKTPANTPGTVIQVFGSGFFPNEQVTATLDPAGNVATADKAGNFATSFTLPFLSPGTYQIFSVGQTSGAIANTHFYLSGFFPGAAPSGYFLRPGDTLTFTGWNFAPNERVTINEGYQAVSQITADKAGGFKNQGDVVFPANAAPGPHSFTVTGEKSQSPITIKVTVGKLSPQIFPSGYFFQPGSNIHFSGFGFAPKETVSVFEGLNPSPVTTIAADRTGSFKQAGQFLLPFDFAGSSRTVTLTGQQSNASASVKIGVGRYLPQLAPSAYFIKAGQDLTVDGWNFAPGETVDINLNGQLVKQVANKTGNIKTSATIPFNQESFTIQAMGESTQAAAAVTLEIGKYNPVVSASKYYMLPGEQLFFSGTGFAPNEPITVQELDSTGALIKSGAGTTDGKGNFKSTNWTLPFGSDSAQTFVFAGGNTTASYSLDVSVGKFNPYLSADKYYAHPGSLIQVKGAGFGRNEKVDVLLNGTAVATATADASGNTGNLTLTLPATNATTANIVFRGQQSLAMAATAISISPFNPQVSPSTYFTLPGSAISFNGYGFMPGEQVSYAAGQTSIGMVTADSKGNLKTPLFTVPFGTGESISFSFMGSVSQKPLGLVISLGQYQPGLTLSSYYGPGGTAVTLNGMGYAPNETVAVSIGGGSIGIAQVSSKGKFTFAAAVPAGSGGNIKFTATGQSSGSEASITFTRAGSQ